MVALSTAPVRARVRYLSSGTGPRADKYAWLNALTWEQVQNAPPIHPEPPFYFFKPFETDAEYWSWLSVEQIFSLGEMCVTTGHDSERVFFSRHELQSVLPNAYAAKFRPYAYRPFDSRWIYHDADYLERARMRVMQHTYQPNQALIVLNQTRRQGAYDYVFMTRPITDKSFLSTEANCYAFPLYRYETAGKQQTLTGLEEATQQSNVRAEVLEQLSAAYGSTVTGEEVFYYIYAVLNAQGYRQTYEDQLRVDFPHVPFPKEAEHFRTLATLGQQLASAHLQETLANVPISFHSAGDDPIEAKAVTYAPATRSIQFNSAGAKFMGVTPEMWDYHIGSYRPLERWLKERNGRRFVLDHSPDPTGEVRIDDYRCIVRAIATALPVHEKINEARPAMITGGGQQP
jgi:hypothetical protein